MSIEVAVFHEDVFYEYFKPFRHPDAQYEIWGGFGLESFGKDLETVKNHDPAYVWTVIDGESGSFQWIIAGAHHVNRVCYLITEVPHNWIDIEFRIGGRPSSLTALGLRRQITRLQKEMGWRSLNAA